jgi:hypothetical protein
MPTYVIGTVEEKISYALFMTISSTTSRVRCMKYRATCID